MARSSSSAALVSTLPPRTWKRPEGLAGVSRCAADLIAEARRPPKFVIDGLAEAGDVMLVTGAEKISLKTWLALARIGGGRWLGHEVVASRTRRVLIISTETRGTVLVRRLLAMCAGTGDEAESVARGLEIIDEPVTILPSSERRRARDKALLSAQLASVRIHDPARRGEVIGAYDEIEERTEAGLGSNVNLLDAIAVTGTWSLIIVDTLRECQSGRLVGLRLSDLFRISPGGGAGLAILRKLVEQAEKAERAAEVEQARAEREIAADPPPE